MSTEETETKRGQADTEQPSTDSAAATGVAPSQSVATSEDSPRLWPTQRKAVASQTEEEARNRALRTRTFGQLLDQFEQEQSSRRKARLSAVPVVRHNRARV